MSIEVLYTLRWIIVNKFIRRRRRDGSIECVGGGTAADDFDFLGVSGVVQHVGQEGPPRRA